MAIPGYGNVATSIERSRSVSPHGQPLAHRRDSDAHVGEPAQQHVHVFGASTAEHDFAAADSHRGEIGRGLDAISDHGVIGGAQRTGLHTVDDDRRRAGTLDVGAHRAQHGAQVGDLRLAGRVVDDRRPLGVHRRSEDVLGGPDAGELERDIGPVQTIGSGLDVPVLQLECRSHRFETLEVHVDGPAAEIVSARQRERHPADSVRARARAR